MPLLYRAGEIAGQDGHCGGGDARYAKSLPQCFGLNMAETLNDLGRQARHASVMKRSGNAAIFLTRTLRDIGLLSAEVAFVLDRRFDGGDIESLHRLFKLELP